MESLSEFDERQEVVVGVCISWILFDFGIEKSLDGSKVLDNLLMWVKESGEGVHGNVQVIFLDGAGVFVELVKISAQAVDRVY
jgi:hypothetical protein